MGRERVAELRGPRRGRQRPAAAVAAEDARVEDRGRIARAQEAEAQGQGEGVEARRAEQGADAPPEVVDEGVGPAGLDARRGPDLPEHDGRVLARDVVRRLAHVAGPHAELAPELEEALREPEGRADPLERRRGLGAHGRQQRRQLRPRLQLLLPEALHPRDLAPVVVRLVVVRRVVVLRRRRLVVLLVVVVVLHALVEVALEVLDQVRERLGAVAHALRVGMRRDAHDARARQLREARVAELLGQRPGHEVARRALAARERAPDDVRGDEPLERDLDDDEHVRQRPRRRGLVDGAQEHVEPVRRRVAQQLQVVGLVLVVRRGVERHDALEEPLAERVVGEERVAVDLVEPAGRGRRQAPAQREAAALRRVEAERAVEPGLDVVARRVADRRLERELPQGLGAAGVARALGGGGGLGPARLVELEVALLRVRDAPHAVRRVRRGLGDRAARVLRAELGDELELERAARALVARHRRREEDDVGP